MPNVMTLLLILVCGYLLLFGLTFFLQNKLLYFPDAKIQYTPGDIGLDFEEVSFSSRDGLKLHGWFVPGPVRENRRLVLFFHGNAGNISQRLDQLRLIHQLGLACFIFDYRGYGKSEGQTSEKGTYLDAEGAWDYLISTRGVGPEDIICWGRSLGGPIAARLARDRTPLALIVESAFTSLPAMARKLYPFLPVKLLPVYRYPTVEYLQSRDCPVLIVHSREDEIVPFSFGRKLFALAREPKEFLELSGGHNDGFLSSGETYTDGVKRFLGRLGPIASD